LVDRPLILRKLSELDEYSKQLGEFANISLEDYSGNWKVQRIIERTRQMMIETCADIANHIISDKGYRVPKTYVDTFKVLYENSIINNNLSGIVAKIAKFRNIIVNQYNKIIDEALVIDILKEHIKDFAAYRDAIIRIL
jgi:uncharacterized protein YutE (UPF0331/DUF86 family)